MAMVDLYASAEPDDREMIDWYLSPKATIREMMEVAADLEAEEQARRKRLAMTLGGDI